MPPFTLKKSRPTKRIRILVRADGTVVVSAPARVPDFLVRRFVSSKTDWITEKLAYFAKYPVDQSHILKNPRMTAANKKLALELVQNRLKYLNEFYNFQYDKVSIKNQKTRWGSCSSKKNLNFNYKILFLTPAEQDYIIVHELCHLAEMNHGAKFWSLVSEQIPDYLKLRASIRKYKL